MVVPPDVTWFVRRAVATFKERGVTFASVWTHPSNEAAVHLYREAGFANTELLFWLFSGQVLIMVIVGGAGTLIGPIIGAAFFMLVSNMLSSWTDSWALFFGLIFIGFVLFAPQGIWGLATRWFGRGREPGLDIDRDPRELVHDLLHLRTDDPESLD